MPKGRARSGPNGLIYVALTPAGRPNAAIAIAACREGSLGVLNLEFCTDAGEALTELALLAKHARASFGVLVDLEQDLLDVVLENKPSGLKTLIFSASDAEPNSRQGMLEQAASRARNAGCDVWMVVNSLEQATSAEEAGADAVVAKGQEAGGWIGDLTSFVLLQELAPKIGIPLFVQGGIGPGAAAACFAAGAAGVVIDAQLLLTKESPLKAEARRRLERMDGSETAVVKTPEGAALRIYLQPGMDVAGLETALKSGTVMPREDLRRMVAWDDDRGVLAIGQDGAFAAGLALRNRTVAGIIAELRKGVSDFCRIASEQAPLAEGSPLAKAHGTRYPIVQGPMTRVSDRPAFAGDVANAGGLPFLALALMKSDEIGPLLEQTAELLGSKPWGVGILGFVPPDLRIAQLKEVQKARPPFALIAGGQPHQARELEQDGIATYLHAPSPGLLKIFLDEGAGSFVFEGRECGGHIGPRTSFVLWQSMAEVLATYIDEHRPDREFRILLAGGIHDGFSAHLASVIAAPLLARGVKVGVLMGTAYLFTDEAVASGAIQPRFQDAAVACRDTRTLEATAGYATRCIPSPFCATFESEKQRLVEEGVKGEDLKQRLEELNIGRSRIASKGQDRNPSFKAGASHSKLVGLDAKTQWEQGMYMIGQIAGLRTGTLTIEQLHQSVSMGMVNSSSRAMPVLEVQEPPPQAAVAIVGMSSILPGSPDLPSFWANILNAVDSVTEVPVERWDPSLYFDPDRGKRDKVYSRWGGFIDEVPFDPLEWGMPPNSVESIEPFQLLALELVRRAIDDAGYANRPFPRERSSVVLGAGGGAPDLTAGYVVRSSLPTLLGSATAERLIDALKGALPEWTEDSFAGLLMNVAAGRVANRFDFGGVNYSVDAACASSLAAVYLAVRDLQARTSDLVIAGGVETIQNPFDFFCFAKTQALSPTGRSRPFDRDADGIAISEGFAALVLKRLEDAERDGDRIYAVIRGVGGSSDGREKGLTAPRPAGQMRALRRAYAQANFSPASVGLIEAHGTGTSAGDEAEIESLTKIFDESGAGRRQTAIGSVKSMIGHTKAAAGVAGVVKVAAALHHRVLPPTLGVKTPNEVANAPQSPLYINSMARPWIQSADSTPRRAGVSSFGFGGTNFHIVLEEYPDDYLPAPHTALQQWPFELFVWRADTKRLLREKAERLLAKLDSGAVPRLCDLAYSLNLDAQRAGEGKAAMAIVATDLTDLALRLHNAIDRLEAGRDSAPPVAGFFWSENAQPGKVVFLFPGQGSQRPNMGRELAVLFPKVRQNFEKADRVLAGCFPEPLSRYVFPPPAFTAAEESLQSEALVATDLAQPALAAAEMAMLNLLTDLGVTPSMVAGHSFGELVALYAGGALSDESLLKLAERRGRFMADLTRQDAGGMAAIAAPPEAFQELLKSGEVTVANMNSPVQTVISGPAASIDEALKWCEAKSIRAVRLKVAAAFHSPQVAPAEKKLGVELKKTPVKAPIIPVFSNSTAAAYPSKPQQVRSLLSKHLGRPVEFVRQIEAMYDAGARVFVEVGPGSVLTKLTGQILGERPHTAISLSPAGPGGLAALLNACGNLWLSSGWRGVDRLFADRKVEYLDVEQMGSQTGRPQYSPTTWLVGGGSVRPAHGEKRARAKLPLDLDLVPRSLTKARPSSEFGPPTVPIKSEQVPPPKTSVRTPSSGPNAAHATTEHFQQVMQRFLRVQESVLLSALAPGSSHTATPKPKVSQKSVPGNTNESSENRLCRFSVGCAVAPAVQAGAGISSQGVIVILDGNLEVGKALAELFETTGRRYLRVPASPSAEGNDELRWGLEQALNELVSSGSPAAALVDLRALGSAGSDSIDGDIASFLQLVQALEPQLKLSAAAGGAVVAGATAMGGGFGLVGDVDFDPRQAWRTGFLKSLAQEWPEVRVKALDFGGVNTGEIAQRVFTEMLAGDGLVEVGYDAGGRRYRCGLLEEPDLPDNYLPLGEQPIYLVTGGARGITAETALAVARLTEGTFVIAGRTALPAEPEPAETLNVTDEHTLKKILFERLHDGQTPPRPVGVEQAFKNLIRGREVRQNLDRLTEAGASVDYRVCDVTDPKAFAGLIDDVYADYGGIDGVLHGAGVIEDALVANKSLDSFRRIFETKVVGASILAEKLRPEALKFLVFFSSVSARFGNRGQADYAAANEVLNKLADKLNRTWPGKVLSINWGPWSGTGMAGDEAVRRFGEKGVGLIPPEDGCRAVVEELSRTNGPKGAEVVIAALGNAVNQFVIDPAEVVAEPLSTVQPGNGAGPAPQLDAQALRLPLLRTNAKVSRKAGGLDVRRKFSLEQDLYLADHVLDGKPVVPMAMAIALMAETAKASRPDLEVLEITDISLKRGIVIERQPESVRITSRPAPRALSNGHFVLDLAITPESEDGHVYYTSQVHMGQRAFDLSHADNGHFSAMTEAGRMPWDMRKVYDEWLFHGPVFEAIRAIDQIGPLGATGWLRPSSPSDCLAVASPGSWLADPILIDAAFQMQVVWVRKHWDITILPLRVASWRPAAGASSTAPDGDIRCELRTRNESRAPISHTDFAFYEADGRLVGLITDLQAAGSRDLNRLPMRSGSN